MSRLLNIALTFAALAALAICWCRANRRDAARLSGCCAPGRV